MPASMRRERYISAGRILTLYGLPFLMDSRMGAHILEIILGAKAFRPNLRNYPSLSVAIRGGRPIESCPVASSRRMVK